MPGTLFLVVGPSGVGKDTLLDGARARLSGSKWFRFVRRVITRPEDAGGEDHIAATDAAFDQKLADGAFQHHWGAHGLRYGIPADVEDDLAAGINVVLNTSRNEVQAFRDKLNDVVVAYISASPSVIETRLRARGRENEAEIAKRLARMVEHPTPQDGALEILNDGTVEEGIAGLVDLIAGSCNLHADVRSFPVEFGAKPVCLVNRGNPIAARLLAGSERVSICAAGKTTVAELGWTSEAELVGPDQCALSGSAITALGIDMGDVVSIERSPSPKSREVLQKKVRGGQLSPGEMTGFVDDLVNGRFSASEIAGFLVSASTNLTIEEVVALTKARASYAHKQVWDADVVVDKHSMGGIPGNRITPIIIPIVAAFGLTMPKTSSRAITSAAGTADMMEVIARVDLTPEEMQRVVRETGACIAWNGRLTHSPVDDVMNAINRPLGLSSSLLDVSSIMSKKIAAGSTHVLIDLPVGPQAKTKTMEEAERLKLLFETVGEGVGLSTRVNLADGTRPIGRGIGPILETRDVFKVLENAEDAAQDLLDKALDYAAKILEWAGGVAPGSGRDVARDLVTSGAALEKLRQISEHQGTHKSDLVPGQFSWEMTAERDGEIAAIDIRTVSAIARAAGAPRDKAAGIYLLANVGSKMTAGQPILRVHSSSQRGLQEARERAGLAAPVVSAWA
ncbi:phosphonate metabolism protein/1,5-bisphosphokinase (PRPP-forming) PhnN [Rhodobacteraceae bacterium D3-12]|nr:phosphonate metabolism protein/1,5-bisphosphokinase (PRPP-forming) PhnN [Rhodobacteraceae bacterium D3-12]